MELKEGDAKKEETKTTRKKSALATITKVFLWILASVLFIIMLALILIQTSFVQNFARKKIVTYLQNKLHTEIRSESWMWIFPQHFLYKTSLSMTSQKTRYFMEKS